jgi:hypothetical protein
MLWSVERVGYRKENMMSIPRQYATDNINRLFVAYAYSYLDGAIEALKENPKAEKP